MFRLYFYAVGNRPWWGVVLEPYVIYFKEYTNEMAWTIGHALVFLWLDKLQFRIIFNTMLSGIKEFYE